MPRVGIIGGSYAGLKALATVFNIGKTANLDVTLVAPSTHAYYNLASPRLISEPSKFDNTIFSIRDIVKETSGNKGRFLHGHVTGVDFKKRELSVNSVSGNESKLAYDILVIASGTQAKWAGYKVNTNHEEARKEIMATNRELQRARSVAIVGGGVTGVETAGEVAAEFHRAKVTLYTGASAPLEGVASALSEEATSKLERLGVEIVNNVFIDSVKHKTEGHGDVSNIVLDNGETREYDVILESFITGPYSAFLPSDVKDEQGYVITDADLLVKGQKGVIALGDIVSGSSKSVVDLKFGQAEIFSATIEKLIEDVDKPGFFAEPGDATSEDSRYSPVTHTMVIPISRHGGVGMSYWIPLPSVLVWWGKAKTYMIEKARTQFM